MERHAQLWGTMEKVLKLQNLLTISVLYADVCVCGQTADEKYLPFSTARILL